MTIRRIRTETEHLDRRPADMRRLRRGLVTVGATSGIAFLLLAIEASSGNPNRVDRALAHLLEARSNVSRSYRLADFVSIGGSPVFVVLAALALAALVWSRRRDPRLAVWCLAAPAAAGLLQLLAKELVGPQQPVWSDSGFVDLTPAFPSGHATGAASIATLVVVLTMVTAMPRSRRLFVIAVALVYALAVATSRIVLDYHLAWDAIGGLLLGTAVTVLSALVALPPSRATEPQRDDPTG